MGNYLGMPKSFVYISGLYMPASGGAEISIYTLIKELASNDYKFHVITKVSGQPSIKYDSADKNIIIYRLRDKNDIENTFINICKSNKVAAIFTQNLWAESAIKLSRKYECPSFYFLRSPFGELDISETGEYYCDFVIANSVATREYIISKFKRLDTIIIPPLINPGDYIVAQNSKEYITMINPIQMKGGDIFKQIAKNIPAKKFLAVKGWSHLMNDKGWDKSLLADLSNGMGISENPSFKITTFEDTNNVELIDSMEDMKSVYAKTRLLLVPSITPEGGPRVAVEAMINGIPVIGSDSGNMRRTIGTGGIIIDDIFNIGEWVAAILKFDIEPYYTQISRQAKSFYNLNVKIQIRALENILKKINGKN